MKKRIVFVDDESNVLQGMRRMLRSMRHEWDMRFAQSGAEALELMAQEHFDVIISDMRMPTMDGAQLLSEVRKRYPHMIRIILSGHADQEAILQSVRPAHQYLSKPCDMETLNATIRRAAELRDLLADESLKGIVAQMDSLPSLPSLYVEIMTELQSADASIQKVGDIISKDLGMTTKIMQMVNSAFFGIPRHVDSPAQAVSLLGLETVKALVLTLEVFSKFDATKLAVLDFEALWEHSFQAGALVKRISIVEELDAKRVDDAYLAGLLHDIGKLVLVDSFAKRYPEIIELARVESMCLYEAEVQVLGASHAEVGAYLLGLWGLPDPIVEAVAFHHCPQKCPVQQFTPLAAVHIADALLNRTIQSPSLDVPLPAMDHDYLARLGVAERMATWEQACEQMTLEKNNDG